MGACAFGNHVTLSLAAKSAGVEPKRLKVVVFKSNAESITAVLGGHLQMVASTVTPVMGQVQAGKARYCRSQGIDSGADHILGRRAG